MSSSIARPFTGFPQAADNPCVDISASTQPERTKTLPAVEDPPDEELMIRLQEGRLDALGHLYRRYARLVMTICLRILRDPSEAEDLVQDVFVFLHRKRELFDPSKGSARSWLVQVTYHRAFNRRDYLRARRYYGHSTPHIRGTDIGTLLTSGNGPGDMLYWSSRLGRVLDELTQDQQLVLKLYYFEGYSVEEISRKIGHSIGNVRNHLYRGLEHMRRALLNGSVQRKPCP